MFIAINRPCRVVPWSDRKRAGSCNLPLPAKSFGQFGERLAKSGCPAVCQNHPDQQYYYDWERIFLTAGDIMKRVGGQPKERRKLSESQNGALAVLPIEVLVSFPVTSQVWAGQRARIKERARGGKRKRQITTAHDKGNEMREIGRSCGKINYLLYHWNRSSL